MKRLFSFAAVIASVMFAASCQRENIPGEEVNAVFQVVIPEDAATKATVADGSLVDKLYYEVYAGGAVAYEDSVDPVAGTNPKQFTFDLALVKGISYDLLFWAQCDGKNYYSWDTLKDITVNYAGNSNDEYRDAFFGELEGYKVEDGSKTIYLTRPFAQVNFFASEDDWTTALPFVETTDGYNLLSKVVMPALPNHFDVSTGNIIPDYVSASPVTFDFSQAPVTWRGYTSSMTHNNQDYRMVAMNYILASTTGDNLSEVNAYFQHNSNANDPLKKTAYQVPVKQNYRTNILGNIFSDGNQFTVILSPGFNKPDYVK